MEGHEHSALNLPMAGVIDEPSVAAAGPAQEEGEGGATVVNRTSINRAPTQTALDRFRQLCLFGRKKVSREG